MPSSSWNGNHVVHKANKAIEVRGLTVRFGTVTAVDDVDLIVPAGEVFGFVGPNGAGKTTTIRCLLDLQRPDAGSVRVLGEDVRRGGGALRGRTGFLPGDLALFPGLTGIESLDFFDKLYRRGASHRDRVLDRLGFSREALGRKVRTYSTGMRQAIGITIALQHAPEVVILDEPTTGLDPLVRTAFLELVREVASEGATVILSNHVLAEVEDCADRIGLIGGGRLHLVETMTSLRTRLPRRVTMRFADGRQETFHHHGSADELIDRLTTEKPVDFEVRSADLQEIFRTLVDGGGESDDDKPGASESTEVPAARSTNGAAS